MPFAFLPSNSNVRRKPLARAIGAIVLASALIPSFSGFAAADTHGPSATPVVATPTATSERVRYTIVLKGGRLDAIAVARDIAQRTLAIVRQNQRWALYYNFSAVPLAALGFIPPWLAALGMSLSSLGVILNALRIGGGASGRADGHSETPAPVSRRLRSRRTPWPRAAS